MAMLACLAGRAQSPLKMKLTIHINSGRLDSAIKQLKEASPVNIAYDASSLDLHQWTVREHDFNQAPLSGILEYLFQKTDVGFKEVSGGIILFSQAFLKTAAPEPSGPDGQGSTSLKGRIVDFETSQPLAGASVQLSGIKRTAVSDEKGYYTLSHVPAGSYEITVTYIGYAPYRETVKVGERGATLDARMQAGIGSLGAVVVSSTRKVRTVTHTTDMQLAELIKNSSTVVSGISSEQIGKTADRNAAQAITRIGGVTVKDEKFVIVRGLNERYNLTYLNDNVAPSTEVYSRAFALDLIPSRIIDKILVFKSPLPENQGDATGGIVKIYTKDARNVKHLDVELQIGDRPGSTLNHHFLTYQGGKYDLLGFDDGTRKLPASVPKYGDLRLATISQKGYVRSFSPILTYGQKTALPNLQFTSNYYNSFKIGRRTLSMLSSLSYKAEYQQSSVYRQDGPSVNDSIQMDGFNDKVYHDSRNVQTAQINLLQNFTYRLRDSSTLQFKNFLLQQGQQSTTVSLSHLNSLQKTHPGHLDTAYEGNWNKNIVLSWSQRFLYAGNFGGTHYFARGSHALQWNAGFTYNRLLVPDERVIRLSLSDFYSIPGPRELEWLSLSRNGGYDPQLVWGRISRTWIQNTEGVYNASADYTFKPKPWVAFKAGTYQQWKQRKLYRRVYIVSDGDLQGGAGDFNTVAGGYGDYMDLGVINFTEQDLGKVWSSKYLRDDHSGLKVYDKTAGSDAYIATEQNNSGYLSFSFTPAHRVIEVYGGMRVEYDQTQVGGAAPPQGNEGLTGINRPIFIDYHKLDWLPSVNVNYRPFQSVVLRLAYGKTLNRPQFHEVSPYTDHDYSSFTYNYGNPGLRPAEVQNYDARIEFYPRNNRYGETISFGAFYKHLDNPIERIIWSFRYIATDPAPLANAYITYQNSQHATIKGLEMELHKKLDFVPVTFFKDLSFIGNVSFIKSEVRNNTHTSQNYFADSINRPLQGQVPYIINAGLYYDNAGSGTRISAVYNRTGLNIYAAAGPFKQRGNSVPGTPEYGGSLLELPRDVVDVALTQRIIKSLQCKFSVQNLLNKPIRMAQDYNFTNKYEPETPPTKSANSGDPVFHGDHIASIYNPGRYFLLAITYVF